MNVERSEVLELLLPEVLQVSVVSAMKAQGVHVESGSDPVVNLRLESNLQEELPYDSWPRRPREECRSREALDVRAWSARPLPTDLERLGVVAFLVVQE